MPKHRARPVQRSIPPHADPLTNEPAASRFQSQRERVSTAGNTYAEARAKWREANEALDRSDPCSNTHPEKVKNAMLAHAALMEASEKVQEACKRGV